MNEGAEQGALARQIDIELVFATPARQVLLKLSLPAHTTVGEAIVLSGIASRFADENLVELQAGIWGRPVERQHRLEHGDRVELYRPLLADPREARRLRARP
ncbi:MAG TPA: RnfH family protein [Woeseiaceae bacterium]|nr:RnfH family protein [Woeseiaceae bacterium]